MEKYVINSTCIAMTDNAASFNVLIKEKGEISSVLGTFDVRDLKTIAEGNILINSNYDYNGSLNFYSSDYSFGTIKDIIVEHCTKRANIIFQPAMQQKK